MNHLVDKGMDPFMLQEFAGWSDIKTAISYVKRHKNQVGEFLARVDGQGSSVAQRTECPNTAQQAVGEDGCSNHPGA